MRSERCPVTNDPVVLVDPNDTSDLQRAMATPWEVRDIHTRGILRGRLVPHFVPCPDLISFRAFSFIMVLFVIALLLTRYCGG